MNIATCQVVSGCTIVWCVGILIRIFFGPFNVVGLVFMHYLSRIIVLSFLSMLTFKTILKTCFVANFDAMSLIAEHKVLFWMGVLTASSTILQIVLEISIRHIVGMNHFGSQCFNTYLGGLDQKGDKDVSSGTGHLLLIPALGLVASLIVFWIIRSQRPKLPMIQNYHNNVMESAANGLTSFAVVMIILVILIFFCLVKFSDLDIRKVNLMRNLKLGIRCIF